MPRTPRHLLSILLVLAASVAVADDSLRAALPSNTLAYLRIVGPDGFSGAPPGSRLDQALTGTSAEDPLALIREGLLADLTADPTARDQGALLELLLKLRAPIEGVLVAPPDGGLQSAALVLRGRLDADSIEAANSLLQRLADGEHDLVLAEPLDAGGTGTLLAKRGVPILVQFQPSGGWLYLMTGMGVDRARLATTIAMLDSDQADQAPDSLTALENRVDQSRQGPFLWLDIPRLAQGLAAVNPRAVPVAQSVMMSGLRGAALGWGTRDGKGRMSLVLEAPRGGGITQMLPPIVNDLSLTSRGEPGLVLSLNLPLPALLRTTEMALAANPERLQKYLASRQEIEAALGISTDRLAATLGPEMVLLSDDIGTFFAVRVGDRDALASLLERVAARPDIDYQLREVDGQTYHHLAMRDLSPTVPRSSAPAEHTAEDASDEQQKDPTGMVALYNTLKKRTRTHLYWVEDGDWLVFGQLPQALFDRHLSRDQVVLKDWLQQTQKQASEHALLLLSAQLDDVPRSLYYAYLQTLEALGDIAGTPIDLFASPGAVALQVPKSGTYGLQLDLGDPFIGLELTFEANPIEFVFGANGMTSIAVVGILAAVAIPAYQDYIVRARVAEGLAAMNQAKGAVLLSYLDNGYLPVDRAAAGLTPDAADVDSEVLANLVVDHGRVTVTFSEQAPAALQGKTLSLTPYLSANETLVWRCGNAAQPAASEAMSAGDRQSATYLPSDIAERHLPASCR